VYANRPTPATGPSSAAVPRTHAPVLAVLGLGPEAPARLGLAPTPALEVPWTLGFALAAAVPALLLYRRLRRADVLDHDHRETILEEVRTDPPATVADLAGLLALDYKTVEHHVRVLEDFGLVEPRRRGQLRELYPAGDAPPELPEPLAGEHETALALLRLVADEPGLTQAEAARRLDLARSTVAWHVDRLAEKGLLRDPDGAPGLEAGPALDEVEDLVRREVEGPVAA
jgi:DNA-binding MarR family transcriptional regulator